MDKKIEVISKHFDYRIVEKKIYEEWEANNCFLTASLGKEREKYVMVIPPPNVTGRLHMGHALNITIQDTLARYNRMLGKDVVWVPGTDHAGIATQTVVKKMLDAEGVDYRNLGREKFVEKVWEWKEKYGGMILAQIKTLGASCDWSRLSFTMDDKLVKAVNHAFKKLYDAGLIYRGERIVNWCPVDQTALSDDEIETKPEGEPGFLYDIAYPLTGDSSGRSLVVSTTRPETMFGDVAVAVHPEDERYRGLVGKTVSLPLSDRELKIISDDYVDPEFGTGCVKITPSHDPNDYEMGLRHKLEFINVMNEDATMNENVPEAYRGLSREACRKQVIKDLQNEGYYKGKHPRNIPLGRSYRSKAIIEYRMSEQWFVKTEELAKKLLERSDELNIYPANLRKLWNHWLENIRDWCISRQIWWGHRIPVWINTKTGEMLVEEEEPEIVKQNPNNWRQEKDVLDTWFSSALWPMSVFGWPEKTNDFERFFPTTTLSTAKDIIFFWVARMGIMSIYFEDKLPFKNVYFHPTVMDYRGKIMSKSKGNGIDPQHIIRGATRDELRQIVLDARPSNADDLLRELEIYGEGFEGVGSDGLRFTLIYLSSHMQSLQISMNSFVEIGRRFITKFWNASRLVLHQMSLCQDGEVISDKKNNFIEDQWLRFRLYETRGKVTRAYESLDFSNLGSNYYQLVWSDFCDWYLEVSKSRSKVEGEESLSRTNLIIRFKQILTLIHPIIPTITEEVYQKMLELVASKKLVGFVSNTSGLSNDYLMTSPFVTEDELKVTAIEVEASKDFEKIKEVVSTLRSFKKQNGLKDKESLKVTYQINQSHEGAAGLIKLFSDNQRMIIDLSKLSSFSLETDKPTKRIGEDNKELFKELVKVGYTIYIDLNGVVEQGENLKDNLQVIKRMKEDIAFIDKRLSNSGFVKNAKLEVVEKEQKRKEELLSTLKRMEESLNK